MTNKDPIQVVFDTRSADFENGKQWNSLIDQVNELLASGKNYREIEITDWKMYFADAETKGEDNVHIPFYRHFYCHPDTNTFHGGFMLFEVLDDLRRHYGDNEFPYGMPDDAELVFTVTITRA